MLFESFKNVMSRQEDKSKIKTKVNKSIFAQGTYYYAPTVTIPDTVSAMNSTMTADASGV